MRYGRSFHVDPISVLDCDEKIWALRMAILTAFIDDEEKRREAEMKAMNKTRHRIL